MFTAAQNASTKWQQRAGSSATEYASGAQNTDKDQSAKAIAAKTIYQQALTDSFGRDAYAKGLQKSGKAGWLAGVMEKGQNNYGSGVSASSSLSKYQVNSGKYDGARKAADTIARGPKGSAGNLQRVTAVVNALHATKIGK